MEIREAHAGDIRGIREVAETTWSDAYQDIIPEDVRSRFLGRAYSESSLRHRITAGFFLVANEDDEVVGFANFFPDAGEPGTVDLAAIYVLPEMQGRGVGTLLLEEGTGRFAFASKVRVRVERDNLAGRRFYEARGFTEMEERAENLFGHEFLTIEMKKEIGGDRG